MCWIRKWNRYWRGTDFGRFWMLCHKAVNLWLLIPISRGENGNFSVQRKDLKDASVSVELLKGRTEDLRFEFDSQHELALLKMKSESAGGDAWFFKSDGQWKQSELPAWTPRIGNWNMAKRIPRLLRVGLGGSAPSISIYNFSEGQAGSKLFEDADFQIDQFLDAKVNPHPRALLGVKITTPIPKELWLSKKMRLLKNKVDELLPGSQNYIEDWSADYKKLLVRRVVLDAPTHFVWLNLEDESSKIIFIDGGNLSGLKLGQSRVVQLQSHDGTVLPAFLTLPQVEDPKQLPVVILMQAQALEENAAYEFDPVASYLGARGYVVLRMYFRANKGLIRGVKDATKSLGGMMSYFEDIDKAIADLAASGLIDAKKVIVAGSGQGAWLSAAAPALCKSEIHSVIAINGVYDLADYRSSCESENPIRNILPLPFADPSSGLSDSELAKLSPMEQLDHYSKHVFLVWGDWSSSEFKAQSHHFRDQAKKTRCNCTHL